MVIYWEMEVLCGFTAAFMGRITSTDLGLRFCWLSSLRADGYLGRGQSL